jgi:cell division protein FtsW
MNVINKIMRGDKVIWIVALLLGIVSLIVVYSASSALAVNNFGGNNGRVLMKHAGTLLIGFAMMFGIYLINYKHYAKAAWLLLIPCLALLAYTLLFGRNINSASRSINIGFFSFQPSEVAKIILITYLARQLVMMGDHLHNFKDVILWLGLPILFTVALIFPENLSTAAILLLVSLVVLFIGRVKFLHILAIVGIGVILFGLYIGVDAIRTNVANKHAEKALAENAANAEPFVPKQTRIATWINRIEAMGESKKEDYNPFDDHHYQQTYAKIAVATSSLFGKGPGKSEQRNFLPHPYSDFIFAIIIEEYGMVGAIIVLMLYVILFTRVLRIMLKRPLTFGAYMAFGLGFLVILQAMINMGVSIGLLPVTGQPLPFVSMGGTSMMATGIILGMILSVTRNMEEEALEAATITEENEQLTSNMEGESHEE